MLSPWNMIEFAVEAKGKLMSRDNLRAINSPRISLLTPVRKEVRENQLWWHASFGMQRSQFTRKEMILRMRLWFLQEMIYPPLVEIRPSYLNLTSSGQNDLEEDSILWLYQSGCLYSSLDNTWQLNFWPFITTYFNTFNFFNKNKYNFYIRWLEAFATFIVFVSVSFFNTTKIEVGPAVGRLRKIHKKVPDHVVHTV